MPGFYSSTSTAMKTKAKNVFYVVTMLCFTLKNLTTKLANFPKAYTKFLDHTLSVVSFPPQQLLWLLCWHY